MLGVKKWVCVDYMDYWGDNIDKTENADDFGFFRLEESSEKFDAHSYIKFNGDAGDIPETFYGQFDAVVSLCCFEHVQTLDIVVEKIYRSLKPGGRFYTSFAPIWSGAIGHHYYLCDKFYFNHTDRDGVPPFIHLLWTEEQTRQYFMDQPLPDGIEQLNLLLEWCFHSTAPINHLFFEDYERIFAESSFKDYDIRPTWKTDIEPVLRQQLCEKYPGYQKFDYNGMKILAVKEQ
jgi:SAM-dependent methyltransferase